ncbi:unnamed protein product [marine sediment metagenome]|uniref:Uncharacterized protein n=1 Tax=marine sediment metagenome TaxID=412755 RepID=X1RKV1_9ZZZZ
MAEIKSLSSIRDKWTRVTPGRTEDYKLGIQNPKRDWETETVEAKDNWKAGIDAAAAKDLFAKGVIKAGSKKRITRKINRPAWLTPRERRSIKRKCGKFGMVLKIKSQTLRLYLTCKL